MVALTSFKRKVLLQQGRSCFISYHQPLWLHIEFQNSGKLSSEKKMIKWFMLNFAGREKCKGCQSGSWEQMSYSSWSSSIRLSFPISSHNWQPRFTSGGRGKGSEIWCRVTRHYCSINQSQADKKLQWIFDGSVFPEMLVKPCITWLPLAWSHPTPSMCISLKNDHS